jgi:hypothetical protein
MVSDGFNDRLEHLQHNSGSLLLAVRNEWYDGAMNG